MRRKAYVVAMTAFFSAALFLTGTVGRAPVAVLAMEDGGIVETPREETETEYSANFDPEVEEPEASGSKTEAGEAEISEELNASENADFQQGEVISENDTLVPEENHISKTEEVEPKDKIVESDPMTVSVPIYNYDIVDVVVPASYAVALNPYGLAINVGDGRMSSEQVISRNYGIINKSTSDKLVTVTFQVEDLNEGKITFVDSAEQALNADEDTYAVYLTMIPSADDGISLNGTAVDTGTMSEALANVSMTRAEDAAVALKAGENSIAFKLSKAVYNFAGGKGISLGDVSENESVDLSELISLAENGKGVTAFTFGGVMNPRADWTKLTNGIRISVVYTYSNAIGDESIITGTGAMVEWR